jgi:hypothetical protein
MTLRNGSSSHVTVIERWQEERGVPNSPDNPPIAKILTLVIGLNVHLRTDKENG